MLLNNMHRQAGRILLNAWTYPGRGQAKLLKKLTWTTSSSTLLSSQVRGARRAHKEGPVEPLCSCDDPSTLAKCSRSIKCQYRVDQVPVFIKTYGCQMNVNDTSIVRAILQDYGYKIVDDESSAEIYLLVTCAIRESAEEKIWGRLNYLRTLKERKDHPLKQVGLLGCMAERMRNEVLKTSLNSVDIVAGPDAYRDLPRLFSVNKLTHEKAVNCLLSFDETYSDVKPVVNPNDITSYLSITRGCDNLCSYCIVPYTRGTERSRPIVTILDEVRYLMDRGVREITLLGQNVNSYRDTATRPDVLANPELENLVLQREKFAAGFKTVYKPRIKGITFDVLLEEVSKACPELRIRFTSPHPKDFTDDVIAVMSKYPNICKSVNLPAQSGSNRVLKKMRRGYTREAYLSLVERMRDAMPNLSIISDFIVGFCGEEDTDHEDTLDLIRKVRYRHIYVFPYSMRNKTHAYHNFKDDVEHTVKIQRVQEVATLFRGIADELNNELKDTIQLVLVESDSRRSTKDWKGRIDNNVKTILPKTEVHDKLSNQIRPIHPGDYVACKIVEANSQTLKAVPLYITSLTDFHTDKSSTVSSYDHCGGLQASSV